MNRQFVTLAFAALTLLPLPVSAQSTADNSFTGAIRDQLEMIKAPIIRTAEKVPEELYVFRPTSDVRSFAQLIGHIADGNHTLCGLAVGMKPGSTNIEATVTTKNGLQKALADSFSFCESIVAKMDDKKGAEVIKTFLGMQPRLMVLAFANSHANEHYGNLVTYMRLKGIVPPTSEPK